MRRLICAQFDDHARYRATRYGGYAACRFKIADRRASVAPRCTYALERPADRACGLLHQSLLFHIALADLKVNPERQPAPPLRKKQAIHGVLRLFPIRIPQRREKASELAVLAVGHLNADENRAGVRALVAIVKEAKIPVRRHRRQELQQRARPLGKLEAE